MRHLLLLPCLAATLAAETPIAVDTIIQKVRLGPDEAWVTRTGRVRVDKAGTVRLRMGRLPDGLTLDDVRVQAKGPEGTSLGEIRVGAEVEKKPETPEAKALLAKLDALHARKALLDAQGQAASKTQAFLDGYQNALTHNSGEIKLEPGLIDFSRAFEMRLAEMQTQGDARAKELAAIEEETQHLEGEWQTLQGKLGGDRTPSQVTVELLLPEPGEVVLELATRTKEARWKPSYEARVMPGGHMEMILYAAVTQASGEDWKDVRLELSNADSEIAREPRRFGPSASLGWRAPAISYPAGIPSGSASVSVIGSFSSVDKTTSTQGMNISADSIRYTPPPPPKPVLEPGAPIIAEASGLFSVYQLDGTKEVPSDGESRRFRVTSSECPAHLIVVTAPRLDTTAYQVARFDLPSKLPLFPGSLVSRYYGQQRLGSGALEIPPAGRPMEIPLGPFQGLRAALIADAHTNPYQKTNIVLTRQTLNGTTRQAYKEEVQTTGQDRVWTLKDNFTLSNDTDQPLEVELQDQLIRSNHESVKVELAPDTTPGSEDRPDLNLRAWTLRVEPRGQKTVVEDLQIHAPKDGDVTGLAQLNLQ